MFGRGFERTIMAHVAHLEGSPEQIAEFVRMLTQSVHPVLQTREGFVEAITLVDPHAGRAIAIALWESKDAARKSNDEFIREGRDRGASEIAGLRREAMWYEVDSHVSKR